MLARILKLILIIMKWDNLWDRPCLYTCTMERTTPIPIYSTEVGLLFCTFKRSCNICRGPLCFLITVAPCGAAILNPRPTSALPTDLCRCAPPLYFFPVQEDEENPDVRDGGDWEHAGPGPGGRRLQHSGLSSSHESPEAEFSITCLLSWDSQSLSSETGFTIVVASVRIHNVKTPKDKKSNFFFFFLRKLIVLYVWKIIIDWWLLSVMFSTWLCYAFLMICNSCIIFCCLNVDHCFFVWISVADPDPEPDTYVFGPPGSGSICTSYGSRAFYHQAKIWFFIFEKWCKCTFKKLKAKKLQRRLEGFWRKDR